MEHALGTETVGGRHELSFSGLELQPQVRRDSPSNSGRITEPNAGHCGLAMRCATCWRRWSRALLRERVRIRDDACADTQSGGARGGLAGLVACHACS